MLKFFRKASPKPLITSMSNINDLVSEGNDYLSDKVIFLDQKLTGNLFCSENIFIEKDGRLDGSICSKHCVVGGIVNGNISATELLEITKTAVIKGKVRATAICIEPGAIVNGAITIGEDKAAIITLANRIKKHTAEEYAAARAIEEKPAEPVSIDLDQKPKSETTAATQPVQKPVITQQVQKEAAPVKEEPKPFIAPLPATQQPTKEEEKPEKLVAAAQPKKPSAPPKEDDIQRWW